MEEQPLKNLSIRARAAYAILCLENVLKHQGNDLAMWGLPLKKLWQITDLQFVDDWLYTTSEILPENIRDDAYSTETFETLELNEYNQLKQLYADIDPLIEDIIEKIFKIGTAEVYAGIKDHSPRTLAPLLDVITLLENKHVPLPDPEVFNRYSMTEKDAWGDRFGREELGR